MYVNRVPDLPFTGGWNRVWDGDIADIKDQGRISRQDDVDFLSVPLSQGL
jgi:hypothetical protein